MPQLKLDDVCGQTPTASICQDNQRQDVTSNKLYGPDGILTKVANILSIVVGVVSTFVMIIGGVSYMVGTGDSSKVNDAKNKILYAAAGLVVAGMAQIIVLFVLNRLK